MARPTIDKPLFEAGMQCAKRLYLEHHRAREIPASSDSRKLLAELGRKLVDLASQAFPVGTAVEAEDFDAAVAETKELLARSPRPPVIFHGAFVGGDAAVRTDILLATPDGKLDIFEVKAGTSVKPRHVADVALQLHAIESAGFEVGHAAILHLNPKYVHKGGNNYPVQQVFKNVDVTARARRHVERVQAKIPEFLTVLDDEGSLDLPTGTWCSNPLPCPFVARCVDEGTENPLIFLPGLTRQQESRFHEGAIEDIAQIDPQSRGLTAAQRRALGCVLSGGAAVEPFLPQELADVDYPLHFVHVQWCPMVLPRFEKTRPWQHLPFQWSMVTVHQDGTTDATDFTWTKAEDPRTECMRSLAEAVSEDGTLIAYAGRFDERVRAMLDDVEDLKPFLRSLLHAEFLDLGQLVRHGAYHPDLRGKLDLAIVHDAFVGESLLDGLEFQSDEDAINGFRRILNTRTRAATREKVGKQLSAYGERMARGMAALYDALRTAEPTAVTTGTATTDGEVTDDDGDPSDGDA